MTFPIDNKFCGNWSQAVVMCWCAAINCNNKTKNNGEVSYFQIPKDTSVRSYHLPFLCCLLNCYDPFNL